LAIVDLLNEAKMRNEAMRNKGLEIEGLKGLTNSV